MADLESLEAVATFSLLSDDVKNGVDEFSSFSVVTLGPVVSCTGLSEDEVVRSEELTERSCSYGVHGTRLEIHEDCSGYISTSSSFVEVDIDSLKLEIRVTTVVTDGVNSVLVRNDLPELGTDLVTALTCLDVNDFSHCIL